MLLILITGSEVEYGNEISCNICLFVCLFVCLSVSQLKIQSIYPMKMNSVDFSSLHLAGVFLGVGAFFFFFKKCFSCLLCEMKWGTQAA